MVQQGISSLNSIASIVGYLLVFVTLSFVALPNYLYLCAALYLLALLIWLRVPADQVFHPGPRHPGISQHRL